MPDDTRERDSSISLAVDEMAMTGEEMREFQILEAVFLADLRDLKDRRRVAENVFTGNYNELEKGDLNMD